MQIKEHLLPFGHPLQNGSYRIVNVLGQGGFGITYEAENTGSKLFPKVAIKEFFMKGCVRGEGHSVQSHSVVEGEFHRFRENFLKEAQMLDRFRHEGIVEVRDLFEENNTAYMVMKFVEGKTMKQVVEESGALPKEKAIGYLQQLSEALSVVHAQNAVHRDISPDNIILKPDGRTVLIDFGAAKQYLAEHTQSSVGLVKDGFSPREQYSLTSKKGPWSDVYALGALGYYLLTAKRPMPSIDRYDDPDWQPVTGHAEVDEVLAKAMGMQPRERFKDAKAMHAALNGEGPPLQSGESDQTYKHTQKQPSDPQAKPERNEPISASRQNPGILKEMSWLETVYVEGGSFEMGSNDGQDDEKPVHSIEVSGFLMGKTEVTVAQFKRFIDATGYQTDAEIGDGSYLWTGSRFEKKMGVDWNCDAAGKRRLISAYDHPVVHVSWNDAIAFCDWASGETGQTYRLPTEAEWEYAAKGGNKSQGYKYAGSNNLDEVAWYGINSGNKTHPVAQKKPNELELYDMSGNVYEWCADWYDNKYYACSPYKNPPGPSEGDSKVVRGGSWDISVLDCRVAFRYWKDRDERDFGCGFRLCRDL